MLQTRNGLVIRMTAYVRRLWRRSERLWRSFLKSRPSRRWRQVSPLWTRIVKAFARPPTTSFALSELLWSARKRLERHGQSHWMAFWQRRRVWIHTRRHRTFYFPPRWSVPKRQWRCKAPRTKALSRRSRSRRKRLQRHRLPVPMIVKPRRRSTNEPRFSAASHQPRRSSMVSCQRRRPTRRDHWRHSLRRSMRLSRQRTSMRRPSRHRQICSVALIQGCMSAITQASDWLRRSMPRHPRRHSTRGSKVSSHRRRSMLRIPRCHKILSSVASKLSHASARR
mmetsp:Transcript_57586/g.160383  ORF Transcript_57586/g.160383 Transcript_57586/m.160383 type:complete len:281 (-) Transcript_57586:393-1235(-)